MSWDKALNICGLLLLLVCFGISAYRIFGRTVEVIDPDITVLRFAHFELEDGVREALDLLARDYESMHAGVKVKQIAIPERFYQQWIRTQLIGEMAPDIVEIQAPYIGDEIKGRFMQPISRELEEPNPYNVDTDLEGVTWRNTFVDGVNAYHANSQHLLDTYAVPLTVATGGMFFNAPLLEAITGSRQPPRTYKELLAFGRQVDDYRERTGKNVYAIAGSRQNAGPFLDGLLSNLTQELGTPGARNMGIYYLQGEWSVYDQAIQTGLRMIRDIAQLMQPGFFLKERDDAVFFFVQERAVMVAASSQDAKTLKENIPFDVGVTEVPIPDYDDPEFGSYMLGRRSEDPNSMGMHLGMVNFGRQKGQALDFLRYLTSQEVHRRFVQTSGWLPSVVGVEPKAGTESFMPYLAGSAPPAGFSFHGLGGLDNMRRLYDDYFHLLVDDKGSVEAFSRAFHDEAPHAIVLDLRHSFKDRKVDMQVMDAIQIAYRRMGELTGSEEFVRKEYESINIQNKRESGLHFWRERMQDLGHEIN